MNRTISEFLDAEEKYMWPKSDLIEWTDEMKDEICWWYLRGMDEYEMDDVINEATGQLDPIACMLYAPDIFKNNIYSLLENELIALTDEARAEGG